MLKKLILIFSIFAFGASFFWVAQPMNKNYTKGQNLENKNKDELIIAAGGEPEGGLILQQAGDDTALPSFKVPF